jgi:SAM-dependent methyltransferase
MWLIPEYPQTQFYGVDVDEEAIRWCSAHFSSSRFHTGSVLPPLPYPDKHFRVIYCLSVFTHLNEPMQDAWLCELRRILQPGGLLIVTVHGHNAASALPPEDLVRLANAGFIHKTSRKLKGIVPEWYHTTWHSKGYIVDRLSRYFQGVRYVEIPDGMQDFVVGFAR